MRLLELERHKCTLVSADGLMPKEESLAMPNPKSNDLAVLADFLARESRRCESFRDAHESLMRIGSLADAENKARLALEAAQADLAWALAEVEAAQAAVATAKDAADLRINAIRLEVEAAMVLARKHHADENNRLAAETEEKHAALKKIVARLEAVRVAAGVIVETLAKEPPHAI